MVDKSFMKNQILLIIIVENLRCLKYGVPDNKELKPAQLLSPKGKNIED